MKLPQNIEVLIFRSHGNPRRISLYPPYSMLLNFESIEFPLSLADIKKFEKN